MFKKITHISSLNNTGWPRAILLVAIGILLLTFPFKVRAGQTAAQLISAVNAKIKQSGCLTATFSMTSGNQTVSGTLKTSGNKFAIETPAVSTWYDGKSMWTYNPRSKETTLVSPTAAELAEANPLMLISSKISEFTATYAKTQKSGLKTVVLTPKTKRTGIKSMHVSINNVTSLPVKLVAVPSSGQTITLTLSSVKTCQNHPASTFTYPKSKFPKVTVVDLR